MKKKKYREGVKAFAYTKGQSHDLSLDERVELVKLAVSRGDDAELRRLLTFPELPFFSAEDLEVPQMDIPDYHLDESLCQEWEAAAIEDPFKYYRQVNLEQIPCSICGKSPVAEATVRANEGHIEGFCARHVPMRPRRGVSQGQPVK